MESGGLVPVCSGRPPKVQQLILGLSGHQILSGNTVSILGKVRGNAFSILGKVQLQMNQ